MCWFRVFLVCVVLCVWFFVVVVECVSIERLWLGV